MKAQAAAVLVAGALLGVSALAGCSVGVPDPAAPKVEQTATALATPTITPGHDAAAVAAKDMPFSAGATLAEGVPVGISGGLKSAPGWTPVKENVAGESQYLKADGCLVAAKVRTNQSPLVQPDDRESTIGLFTYLDPTILPAYLKTATLRWGGEPDKRGPSVEVLVLEKPGLPGAKSTAVLARVFGTAASSVYVSISCPDAATLAAARAEVAERLVVVPPSS
ncbi:hypothetical protein [Pseudarthrobacter sulfonivorans]|uniref:hypothetical protein n=1 Tax=Pseudarthrobacter sulfonivorans TaxID=121292 RepID=UPI00286ADB85|nr:hypothetical protein [Pseudarthrobacter sulfonivorans]